MSFRQSLGIVCLNFSIVMPLVQLHPLETRSSRPPLSPVGRVNKTNGQFIILFLWCQRRLALSTGASLSGDGTSEHEGEEPAATEFESRSATNWIRDAWYLDQSKLRNNGLGKSKVSDSSFSNFKNKAMKKAEETLTQFKKINVYFFLEVLQNTHTLDI